MFRLLFSALVVIVANAPSVAMAELKNLQVTIEVRFITVQDKFFERIGVDFDDIDKVLPGTGATLTDINDAPLTPYTIQARNQNTGTVVNIGRDGSATLDEGTYDFEVSSDLFQFGMDDVTFETIIRGIDKSSADGSVSEPPVQLVEFDLTTLSRLIVLKPLAYSRYGEKSAPDKKVVVKREGGARQRVVPVNKSLFVGPGTYKIKGRPIDNYKEIDIEIGEKEVVVVRMCPTGRGKKQYESLQDTPVAITSVDEKDLASVDNRSQTVTGSTGESSISVADDASIGPPDNVSSAVAVAAADASTSEFDKSDPTDQRNIMAGRAPIPGQDEQDPAAPFELYDNSNEDEFADECNSVGYVSIRAKF